MLNVKLDGIETIQEDYDEFQVKVRRATNYGLKAFASELTPALQRHIQTDVYDAYDPIDYMRRHDNPQFGRSIYSDKNMAWNLRYMGNGEQSVEFTYSPDGRNTHYPNSPYYTDPDSLIEVIQQDKGYLWLKDNNGSIGVKRPFWAKFVTEVGQMGDTWFVKGFNQYDRQLGATVDNRITGLTQDMKLDFTGEVKTSGNKNSSNWDDDELPF